MLCSLMHVCVSGLHQLSASNKLACLLKCSVSCQVIMAYYGLVCFGAVMGPSLLLSNIHVSVCRSSLSPLSMSLAHISHSFIVVLVFYLYAISFPHLVF